MGGKITEEVVYAVVIIATYVWIAWILPSSECHSEHPVSASLGWLLMSGSMAPLTLNVLTRY